MKNFVKKLALCVMAGMFFASCNADKYTITADITNLADQKVYLNRSALYGLEHIDTAECVNGKFIFTGKLEHNDYRIITFADISGEIPLYIDNSNIKIKGDYTALDDLEITGSKAMDYYASFAVRAKEHQIYSQTKLAELQTAQKEKDSAKINLITKEFLSKHKDYVNENLSLAETHPGEFISFFVAVNSSTYATPERIKAFYDKVPEYIKSDPRIMESITQLENIMKLSAGNPVPEFEIHNFSFTETLTVDSLKGHKTLMYITTPDVAENEQIYPMLKKAKEKGVEVAFLMLLMDANYISVMEDYIKENGLEGYKVMMVNDEFAENMGAITPRVIAVGPDAKFIGTAIEVEEVEELVKKVAK